LRDAKKRKKAKRTGPANRVENYSFNLKDEMAQRGATVTHKRKNLKRLNRPEEKDNKQQNLPRVGRKERNWHFRRKWGSHDQQSKKTDRESQN